MKESSVVGKVYILTHGEYSSYGIERVFTTEEKAEKYMIKLAEEERQEDIEYLEKAKQDLSNFDNPNYEPKLSLYKRNTDPDYRERLEGIIAYHWNHIQNNSKDSRVIGDTMMINSHYLRGYSIEKYDLY